MRHADEICAACRAQLDVGDGIDTRSCALCSATVCRHSARKATVRSGAGPWEKKIVCNNWTGCIVRHGQLVIK